jgi:hypothetical protein
VFVAVGLADHASVGVIAGFRDRTIGRFGLRRVVGCVVDVARRAEVGVGERFDVAVAVIGVFGFVP